MPFLRVSTISLLFFILPPLLTIRSFAAGYNYGEVLQKSMWFYEVQRSGPLPVNNRVEWRGSSAVADGGDVDHDLSGGWYDAGDNMKFNFPMASSVTLLAWGGLEFGQGYRAVGQWGWLLNNIKWVTDYFIKCHTAPNEFYGQIGVGMTDHKWWGAPEVFPNERPSFKIDAEHPGSELAAEAAAALAAASLLFRVTDAAYADLCVKHAEELFNFANTHRGLYHETITDATDFYKSWSGYEDELTWAALWLYLATGASDYLAFAENNYPQLLKEPQSTTPKYKEALSWDDKTYGCYVLLAKITNKPVYHEDAQRWLDWWTYGYASGEKSWNSEKGIAYTPGGLAWVRQWGPLRYAANTAFAAMSYCKCKNVPTAKRERYQKWAKSQIDYALGDNELKRSYVCGFGVNPPVKPHHRSMHGPYLDDNGRTPERSRHTLFGALVGGPGQDGSFIDDRLDAVRNEVATDYNAGFSSALACLVQNHGGTALPDFPAPAVRDTEYVLVAKINMQGDRFTEISATVHNRTTWPARYSEDLRIRYYIDLSEVIAAGMTVDDVITEYRNCALCSGEPVVSPLVNAIEGTDIYYTEISFDGELIYPGGQSAHRREVQFRIGLPDNTPETIWDPGNDPSLKGLTTLADTCGYPFIPVYENGALVWGVEIDGTEFAPSVWNMPVFSEPAYFPSGWDVSLFKGASPESIHPQAQSPVRSRPYRLTRSRYGKGFSIVAAEPTHISLFTLNGKLIQSTDLQTGETERFSLNGCSSEIVIISLRGERCHSSHYYINR